MRAYSRTSVSPRQPPCRTFASERLVRTVLRLVRSMVRTPSRSYCSHQRALTSKQTVILFDSHHASASSASSSKGGGGVLFGLVSRRQKTKRTSRTPPRKRYRTVTSRTRSDREIWAVGARGESPRPSAFASSPFLSFPFLPSSSSQNTKRVYSKSFPKGMSLHTKTQQKAFIKNKGTSTSRLSAPLVDFCWVSSSRASLLESSFPPLWEKS